MDFVISWPEHWRELDLTDPAAKRLIGEADWKALVALREGSERARLLMARSLFSTAEDGGESSMGLVVTLSVSPESAEPLEPDAFGSKGVTRVSLILGKGVRRRTITRAQVPGGTAAMLVVQYFIQSEAGLVTMTYSTASAIPQEAERWDALFSDMAATAWLRPPAG